LREESPLPLFSKEGFETLEESSPFEKGKTPSLLSPATGEM
jgi:hypothetical protein